MSEPELGFCPCGRPATIPLENSKRVAVCERCWRQSARRLLQELKANQRKQEV